MKTEAEVKHEYKKLQHHLRQRDREPVTGQDTLLGACQALAWVLGRDVVPPSQVGSPETPVHAGAGPPPEDAP